MTFTERRRSHRTPVDFFVEETRGDRTWLHPATSLSTDGLYVLVSDDRVALDPTQLMALAFTLPSGTAVRTSARIAYGDDRHGQRGIGLQFVDLDPDAHGAIRAYVTAASHTRMRAAL